MRRHYEQLYGRGSGSGAEEWDGGVAKECDRERGEGVRGASWANELQGPTVEVQRSERGWNRTMTQCSQRVGGKASCIVGPVGLVSLLWHRIKATKRRVGGVLCSMVLGDTTRVDDDSLQVDLPHVLAAPGVRECPSRVV